MNEFYDEITTKPEIDLEPAGHRHYITTDTQGRITSGWSDGPHPERDTTNAICINEQGGYQFRLFPGGEENPSLFGMDGIPLYKYQNGEIILRDEEELKRDRLPSSITAKEQEILSTCHETIVKGFDIGEQHFSLEETDQLNLTTAAAAIKDGLSRYPYHADGEPCRMYTANEINTIVKAATFHKLYHTTLCNHLLQQLKRVTEHYQLLAIDYSPESLSSDLRENFRSIMTTAQNL